MVFPIYTELPKYYDQPSLKLGFVRSACALLQLTVFSDKMFAPRQKTSELCILHIHGKIIQIRDLGDFEENMTVGSRIIKDYSSI